MSANAVDLLLVLMQTTPGYFLTAVNKNYSISHDVRRHGSPIINLFGVWPVSSIKVTKPDYRY